MSSGRNRNLCVQFNPPAFSPVGGTPSAFDVWGQGYPGDPPSMIFDTKDRTRCDLNRAIEFCVPGQLARYFVPLPSPLEHYQQTEYTVRQQQTEPRFPQRGLLYVYRAFRNPSQTKAISDCPSTLNFSGSSRDIRDTIPLFFGLKPTEPLVFSILWPGYSEYRFTLRYDRLVQEEELHAQLRTICFSWYRERKAYHRPGSPGQFIVDEAVLPRFAKWSTNSLRSAFVAADSIFVEGLYRRNDPHDSHSLFIIQFSVTSTNLEASWSRYTEEPDYNEEMKYLANVFDGQNF